MSDRCLIGQLNISRRANSTNVNKNKLTKSGFVVHWYGALAQKWITKFLFPFCNTISLICKTVNKREIIRQTGNAKNFGFWICNSQLDLLKRIQRKCGLMVQDRSKNRLYFCQVILSRRNTLVKRSLGGGQDKSEVDFKRKNNLLPCFLGELEHFIRHIQFIFYQEVL